MHEAQAKSLSAAQRKLILEQPNDYRLFAKEVEAPDYGMGFADRMQDLTAFKQEGLLPDVPVEKLTYKHFMDSFDNAHREWVKARNALADVLEGRTDG